MRGGGEGGERRGAVFMRAGWGEVGGPVLEAEAAMCVYGSLHVHVFSDVFGHGSMSAWKRVEINVK